jgi:hypothetical protein
MNGIGLIAVERERQVVIEGWTPEHDDAHLCAELTNAACAYAEAAAMQMYGDIEEPYVDCSPDCWPWRQEWWKPSNDPIRNLVKAGALIAAEIDRLQRRNGNGVQL